LPTSTYFTFFDNRTTIPMECQVTLATAKALPPSARSRSSTVSRWVAVGLALTLAQATSAATESGADGADPSKSASTRAPRFRVQRYEIQGTTVLSPETVDRVLSGATGEVTIVQIRSGLLKLQEAYRDHGFPRAALTMLRQPLTNGVVQVRVFEGASTASAETETAPLPAWAVPTYEIRHFEVRGNRTLRPEEIDGVLSAAAGPATDLDRLHQALGALQAVYRQRGLSLASVTLPQQLLTDGTIVIQVDEGSSPEPAATAKIERTVGTPVPAPAPAPRTFEVRQYQVSGNTLLRPETIDAILNPATGTNVTFAQIQKALGALQLAYRERGFASVGVSLPQQRLTNATVNVQVTEGRLVEVRVTGNHHFSSNNVMSTLPSLREAMVWRDEVVNSRVLQREVDLANQNRDRQVYPVLNAGPEPGTSELDLRVKDRLPLHARIELNNQSTPGTPEWRVNTTANYNNLWQQEHALGVFYGFTPEAFKEGSLVDDYLLNRPLVANYGAYYRIPLGQVESVQERISSSANFGYNEATHQFRLPPPGGRPDLTFSVSGSSSDTGVSHGPQKLVSQTPLLTVISQDTGQELTTVAGAGTALNFPWALSDTRRFNFSAGLDWKHSQRDSYNTNNFFITTVVTNAQGSQTIESQVPSPQPTRHSRFTYLPLTLGLDYSQTDSQGNLSAHLGVSGNLFGGLSSFPAFSYSSRAQPGYGKASLSFTRDQKVLKNWSLLFRASAQAATGPLVSDEQFALGGVNSVRGYLEADERGDDGWFGSVELRTPFIATQLRSWSGTVPAWVRGSLFIDGGQRLMIDDIAGAPFSRFMSGTGLGVSANINNHVDLRLMVGWPLLDSLNARAGDPHAYLSLGGQF